MLTLPISEVSDHYSYQRQSKEVYLSIVLEFVMTPVPNLSRRAPLVHPKTPPFDSHRVSSYGPFCLNLFISLLDFFFLHFHSWSLLRIQNYSPFPLVSIKTISLPSFPTSHPILLLCVMHNRPCAGLHVSGMGGTPVFFNTFLILPFDAPLVHHNLYWLQNKIKGLVLAASCLDCSLLGKLHFFISLHPHLLPVSTHT